MPPPLGGNGGGKLPAAYDDDGGGKLPAQEEMTEEMAEVLREEAEIEAAYQKEFWGEKS